jgi:predicted DNA-binding protein YlxM (UPF0122 family)
MFGKLGVLESKLSIYEDLSKEMLDKLERAVSSIQDNTNKTAIILERHENRLDEGDKANSAIVQMIKDHQKYDDRMFRNIDEKMGDLEKKVDKNGRFVVSAMAVIATVVTVLQVAPPIIRLLTPATITSTIVPGTSLVNGPN